MSLTPKQAAFAREYLVDLNATQAAIRAGYSERTAASVGFENLRKPKIADQIRRAMDARAERTEITADRVIAELAKIAFANLADYFHLTPFNDPVIDLSRATRDQLAALTAIQVDDYTEGRGEDSREVKRVKIKMADKKAALELLGRHLGLWDAKTDDPDSTNALKAFVDALRA